MRKILGKLILFLPIFLFAASVSVSVDKQEVNLGDSVTFTITAKGKDVTFPQIYSIGNYKIIGTAQSSNISIINGNISKSISKSYTFTPTQDVIIPSYEVKIDGKIYKTKPIKIKVVKNLKSNTNLAQFLLNVDKKEVFVGEPIKLSAILQYKKDKNIVGFSFIRPHFSNFWIKQIGDVKKYIQGDFIVAKVDFLIFPQKSGEFSIGPIIARLSQKVREQNPFGNDPFFNDPFFNSAFVRVRNLQVASNSINIKVKPLPGNIYLYGQFKMKVSVDKKEVEVNKPVKLTIKISGYGNIDDIKKFNLNILNGVVYADEPKIKTQILNGKYQGEFIQNITIVADSNFTIPSLELKYFDSRDKKIKVLKSKPIHIVVKGGKKPAAIQTKAQNSKPLPKATKEQKSFPIWLIFILGSAFGGLIVYMVLKFKNRDKNSVSKAILKAKSDKELLDILLPYIKDDKAIEEAVKKLEENIFKGTSHKVDKKLLSEIVEELEEKE